MGEPSELPILFSTPMVHALLAGAKTQTRRIVKLGPDGHTAGELSSFDASSGVARFRAAITIDDPVPLDVRCPYCVPGDRLWVRETHAVVPASAYRCSREEDGSPVPHQVSPDGAEWAVYREGWSRSAPQRWRPSIHMPRWASRIVLEVTDLRVERLQDITEEDAKAEGISQVTFIPDDGFPPSLGYMVGADDGRSPLATSATKAFRRLWDEINGDRASWESNPWVWVVGFTRVADAAGPLVARSA